MKVTFVLLNEGAGVHLRAFDKWEGPGIPSRHDTVVLPYATKFQAFTVGNVRWDLVQNEVTVFLVDGR